MNQDNYASLEASKRLVEAGIVLETDMAWAYMPKDLYRDEFRAETIWKWRLVDRKEGVCGKWFPAPLWTELWRELPERTFSLRFNSVAEEYLLWLEDDTFETTTDNPTDALIDLLIWVRKEAKV